MFPYSLTRSRRKTIALRVDENACILVRAPYFVPGALIAAFVKSKEEWIQHHLTRIQNIPKKTFSDGERFLYLGDEFPLRYSDISEVRFTGSEFLFPKNCKNPSAQMADFYQKFAHILISERVSFFAKKSGLIPTRIRITSAKTRWGSCSPKNTICFSWRLLGAPLGAIDSVVAHELAHIVHKNHSPAFWKQVSEIFPEWKDGHDWLRKNGRRLSF